MRRKEYTFLTTFAIMLVDIAFLIISDLTGFMMRFNGAFPPDNFDAYLKLSPFIITIRIASFFIFHLYEKPKFKSNFETFVNVLKATSISSTLIIFALYFTGIEMYSRSIALSSWILTIFFVSGWRFVAKEFIEFYLGKDFFRARLIVIGTGEEAEMLLMNTLRDAAVNYKFLGFIRSDDHSPISVDKDKIIGGVNDMPSIIVKNAVDEIIIADSKFERRKITLFVDLLIKNNITLKSAPSSYERVVANIMFSNIEAPFEGPTFSRKPSSFYWGIKRILDMAVAVLLFIITLPIVLISACLIKLSSRGPILYYQKRVGQNGKMFIMCKLRTMYFNTNKGKLPRWARKSDPRITPVGRILRRYRIDELPQLINVLRNEMSLIGPRPETPIYTHRLIRNIAYYAERLQVKPGISGWAQVNLKYAASEEASREKLIYDLFYTQNVSFTLDLLIALKTLKVVLTGKGAQ
ncbi:MAG: sugar transferase [Candidatus Omnitrophica bacterium]|nr:sugar transferase [Candidatus Omnitrophota bacterium]